jgi:hypothetical protein
MGSHLLLANKEASSGAQRKKVEEGALKGVFGGGLRLTVRLTPCSRQTVGRCVIVRTHSRLFQTMAAFHRHCVPTCRALHLKSLLALQLLLRPLEGQRVKDQENNRNRRCSTSSNLA